MNKTVHIFFNGAGVEIPPDNAWDKFKEIDALRTFLICAESWARHGWEVKRLTTYQPDYLPMPILAVGRISSQRWYAPGLWQFIPKALAVAERGYNFFATMDVINFGFRPEDFFNLCEKSDQAYYFQPEHFSLSAFCATPGWLKTAGNILVAYDRGALPEIRGQYVSDERILREFHAATCFPVQKFACNPGNSPLIHFARSTLGRIYSDIPLSPPCP